MVDKDSPRAEQEFSVRRRAEQLLESHLRDPRSPSSAEVEQLAQDCVAQCSELEARNQQLFKVQQQLKRLRDRYVDLYDFAPVGYVTLDEDCYVQEVNRAGAKMLGVANQSLIGYPLADYVAKEDQAAFRDHIRHSARQRQESTCEATLIARDGRQIAVQLHSIPVDEEDGIDEKDPNIFLCLDAKLITSNRSFGRNFSIRRVTAFLANSRSRGSMLLEQSSYITKSASGGSSDFFSAGGSTMAMK